MRSVSAKGNFLQQFEKDQKHRVSASAGTAEAVVVTSRHGRFLHEFC
jgi:hypothetical protein